MPTLFGYLGWQYTTALYGQDLNQMPVGQERAFLGNYRTLGMLQGDVFTQIDDRRRVKQFRVTGPDRALTEIPADRKDLINATISWYQTASERFKHGKMKEK